MLIQKWLHQDTAISLYFRGENIITMVLMQNQVVFFIKESYYTLIKEEFKTCCPDRPNTLPGSFPFSRLLEEFAHSVLNRIQFGHYPWVHLQRRITIGQQPPSEMSVASTDQFSLLLLILYRTFYPHCGFTSLFFSLLPLFSFPHSGPYFWYIPPTLGRNFQFSISF